MHGLRGSAGDWCAQKVVIELLRDLWSDPANAWLIGDFLLMPDHLHFFVTPKQGCPWVDVERWTAFWKDRFSKRCGNPAWRWQRGLFHHRLSASVSQTTRHFSCPPLPQPRGLSSISKPRCLPRSRKARRVAYSRSCRSSSGLARLQRYA
jgi:hypothetical protein